MQDEPRTRVITTTNINTCQICKNSAHEVWGRTSDDKGQTVMVCRLCWEAQYPCDQSANFVKIPYRVKCIFGWVLTSPVSSVTIIPGDYEIGVIDSYVDACSLWVYHDELQLVHRDTPTYLPGQALNNIQQELLKSSCSCEQGYLPVVTLYSFLKRYAILYHKDNHIKKRGF